MRSSNPSCWILPLWYSVVSPACPMFFAPAISVSVSPDCASRSRPRILPLSDLSRAPRLHLSRATHVPIREE